MMSTSTEENILSLDVMEFDKTLSINVYATKDGENATLKSYFGLLSRSNQKITR